MPRSLQEWACVAYDDVQFACNVSGIVFAFERCIEDLAAEAKRLNESESWIDKHPISVCFSDKFDDLSRSRNLPAIHCEEHLSKLASQFAARMRELCEESRRLEQGTDWRNEHPKAQAFVRKIVSVTRSRQHQRIFEVLAQCEEIARGNG